MTAEEFCKAVQDLLARAVDNLSAEDKATEPPGAGGRSPASGKHIAGLTGRDAGSEVPALPSLARLPPRVCANPPSQLLALLAHPALTRRGDEEQERPLRPPRSGR
jgi:hypothetical protein